MKMVIVNLLPQHILRKLILSWLNMHTLVLGQHVASRGSIWLPFSPDIDLEQRPELVLWADRVGVIIG